METLDDTREPRRKRLGGFIRKLERFGWRLAMKHDMMGAKKVGGENQKVTRLYDLWAPVYDLMFRRLEGFQEGRTRLVKAVVRPGDRVMDMGTGTGMNLEPVYELTGEVHALDLHEKMLRKAQKWIGEHGHAPHLVRASATELPYREGSFDAIVSAYMMVYLTPDQYLQCLHECRRVLRHGGRAGFLCGQGESSPRNPRREQWLEYLYAAGFAKVEFDDFFDVLRIVVAS